MAKGNLLKTMGAFAQGFSDEKRRQAEEARKKELHDLQVQRARDEKQMNAEIQQVATAQAKPSPVFVVQGADGTSTVYADADKAADAAAAMPGAQVLQKVAVGNKQFDDIDAAKDAAEAMNSPLAKTRQAAQIALKYNRPDVHEMHMKAYKVQTEANRADMMEAINMAEQTGDPSLALKAYNERLPNGMKAEMVKGEDGSMALQVTKKGQPVGAPKPLKSMEEFYAGAKQFVATTPDNYLEVWKHSSGLDLQNRGLALQERGVASQEKVATAGIKKTEAEVAQMPEEMKLKRQQVQAQQTSAGASVIGAQAAATNAATNAEELRRPKLGLGINTNDDVVAYQTEHVLDPKTKQYGLKISPPQVLKGVQPNSMARPPKDAGDPLGLGLPAAQPLTIDFSKIPPKK